MKWTFPDPRDCWRALGHIYKHQDWTSMFKVSVCYCMLISSKLLASHAGFCRYHPLNPVNLLPGATLMGLCINNIHIQYTITYMNYLHVHHAHIYIYIHNYIYICVCVIHTQIWISKAKMQHPPASKSSPVSGPKELAKAQAPEMDLPNVSCPWSWRFSRHQRWDELSQID